jgi:hypothetical protein
LTGIAALRLKGGGRAVRPAAARFKTALAYWQPGNLNDAIRVLQLNGRTYLKRSELLREDVRIAVVEDLEAAEKPFARA